MLISYKNVEIRQDEQIVLRDVNFDIRSGEMVYLLGRVGCGKSTLMKTFYGELPIFSGEASLLDYDLAKLRRKQIPYLRRKVGIVFQDFQLLTDRTVEENLMFVLKATGWKDKQMMRDHVKDVLEQVGMPDKAYKMPHQLSGGEQQRIVIARALLNSPALILADEPTGNLDRETGDEIMQLISAIQQSGTTVIMSTHNPDWVERYPGRNFRFADGRITEDGVTAAPTEEESVEEMPVAEETIVTEQEETPIAEETPIEMPVEEESAPEAASDEDGEPQTEE